MIKLMKAFHFKHTRDIKVVLVEEFEDESDATEELAKFNANNGDDQVTYFLEYPKQA